MKTTNDLGLMIDELWCLVKGQDTVMTSAEIAVSIIDLLDGFTLTKADGTVLPAHQFKWYADDLRKATREPL